MRSASLNSIPLCGLIGDAKRSSRGGGHGPRCGAPGPLDTGARPRRRCVGPLEGTKTRTGCRPRHRREPDLTGCRASGHESWRTLGPRSRGDTRATRGSRQSGSRTRRYAAGTTFWAGLLLLHRAGRGIALRRQYDPYSQPPSGGNSVFRAVPTAMRAVALLMSGNATLEVYGRRQGRPRTRRTSPGEVS